MLGQAACDTKASLCTFTTCSVSMLRDTIDNEITPDDSLITCNKTYTSQHNRSESIHTLHGLTSHSTHRPNRSFQERFLQAR